MSSTLPIPPVLSSPLLSNKKTPEMSEIEQKLDNSAEVAELESLVNLVYPMIRTYIEGHRDQPVVNFITPAQFQERMNLVLPEEPIGLDGIQQCITQALEFSVRTGNPLFLDKLYAGSDPIGQIAEWLIAVLNTNCHTFAVAPAFVMMELECVKRMSELLGYDSETSEGIFCPGGSYSNLVAMLLARHRTFPSVRTEGYAGQRPVAFISAQSHYSLKRAAMVLGIGFNNCVEVACDAEGRMRPDALEAAIERTRAEGKTPFFICGTAGTTVLGAFDPFHALADVAARHGVWFHVDGSWGGSSLMSRERRGLMAGAERADSCTWNPHKMMGVPHQCSVVLVKQQGQLAASNASCADYLFHAHEFAAYDLGDKTLQCGRRADAFKLWLSWQHLGLRGFASRVDAAFDLSREFTSMIGRRQHAFRLVVQPASLNICFWFVPPSLRSSDAVLAEHPHGTPYSSASPLVAVHGAALDSATRQLYDRMQRRGRILVNFNPLADQGLPRFLRLIVNSPKLRESDLAFVLDQLEEMGADL